MPTERQVQYGDGYIERRTRTDGAASYRARWRDGSTWRSKTFAVRDQAVDWLQDVERGKRRGTYREPSTLTVREVVAAYIVRGAHRWSGNTVSTYRQRAVSHIYPDIGSQRLQGLSTTRIQHWVDDLTRSGISTATVEGIGRVLSGALREAVSLQIIAHNPATGIRLPAPGSRAFAVWSKRDVRAVMDALVDDPYWLALYRLALSTGIRPGELRALRWADLDLRLSLVTVSRTVSRDADGHVHESMTTKTKRTRTIALQPSCVAALQRHQRAAGNPRSDQLVFAPPTGRFLSPTTWRNRHRQLVRRTGVPAIRLHDLRHTAATLMLEQGFHPKIVQEILGHSSIAETLDRYSHVSVDLQRAAMDRMDAWLNASDTPDLEEMTRISG